MSKRKSQHRKPQAPRLSGSSSEDKNKRSPRIGGGNGHWLFGHHAVLAALSNPERKTLQLLVTKEAQRTLEEKLPGSISMRVVQRADIDAVLPPGAVHQGIGLQTEPLENADISDVPALAEGKDKAVVVVLDQVSDPHNVGAILRSAAAFGAIAVVVQDRHSPEESGTLAKSASGALEAIPLVRVTNLSRALEDLKEAGFWTVGLDGYAEQTIGEADLPDKAVLVMGAEGKGLRRLTAENCDLLVRLPMSDAVESLNVSNAAAVALYE